MRSQVLCFIAILQILNMSCMINSRPFLPSGPETSPTNLNFNKEIGEEFKEVSSKIGSSPPSCEHKCYGCMPCQAIQVPTITSRVGVQYANYEPEGWKCKCGPTLYSP